MRFIAGDVISICPPLIIKPAEIDELFDKLTSALNKTLDWAKREQLLRAGTPYPAIVHRTHTTAAAVAVTSAVLFRLVNLRKRYHADGGPAITGSSSR